MSQTRGSRGSHGSADRYEPAEPTDLVSFSVVCRPKSVADIEGFRSRLHLSTLDECLPDERSRQQVSDQLQGHGFEVFDVQSPVVSARGPVSLFTAVFDRELVRRIRTVQTPLGARTETSIVLPPGAELPAAETLAGALLIVVQSRPLFMAPRLPPDGTALKLHAPGDIAQLTHAAATHRRMLGSGDRATGSGVGVAVLDTGFATHPFYSDHKYHIVRRAAPDASHPERDPEPHGTMILTGLFACAPDVDAYAIKLGEDPTLGFAVAATLPNVKVISLSWVYSIAGQPSVPADLLPLQLTILYAISTGVTVVAAAGNGEDQCFPAMMREVVAVGGVTIDTSDSISAWNGSSSFSSAMFPGRDVPDLCALASTMWLPIPGLAPNWISDFGATSCATTQVAGVAALLLQKSPGLLPAEVKDVLTKTAEDVTTGTTASGDPAHAGVDRATGYGFVNALNAWSEV